MVFLSRLMRQARRVRWLKRPAVIGPEQDLVGRDGMGGGVAAGGRDDVQHPHRLGIGGVGIDHHVARGEQHGGRGAEFVLNIVPKTRQEIEGGGPLRSPA